jgi:hypothetical protein
MKLNCRCVSLSFAAAAAAAACCCCCLLLLQVRLTYAGVELDPSKDSTPFKLNPKITMLQCMMRMKGGLGNTSHSFGSASLNCSAHPAAAKRQLSVAFASGSTVSSSSSSSRRRSSPLVTAPGSGKGFSAQVQLAKQFRHIMRHPIPGVSVAPDEDDEMTWHVKVS